VRVAALVVAVLGSPLAGCGGSHHPAVPAATPAASPSPAGPSRPADDGLPDPAHLPRGWSLVAWPQSTQVPVFGQIAPVAGARPADTAPTGPVAEQPTSTLTNPNAQGAPLALLVQHYQPDWLQVALPVRPNGSAGWIRTNDVRLAATPYAVTVDRASHLLTVFKDGSPAKTYPVGIGTGGTPTPTGSFYLADLLRPANPNGPYGPYAFGLSGFSDVLTTFNGADGIIGLHGTNQPGLVGTDVSHGCIRLRNADIVELAETLPVGTPITII
jgi:lipoprotein-anchoring transpeptidase ErfK/SrfK